MSVEGPLTGDITKSLILLYKRKSIKYDVYCGKRVLVGERDIIELQELLGEDKCALYHGSIYNHCVVCDDICVDGEFAVETVLFIPNKVDQNNNDTLERFRAKLPRICCHECGSDYAQEHREASQSLTARPIAIVWKEHLQEELFHRKNSLQGTSTFDDQDPVTNEQNPLILSEAEKDPYADGFLVCTQLVKTGGADQGGLVVGDIFIEFGHYSKKRFPGLKAIANLVRRSAGKEIPVVVLRRLEANQSEEDGSNSTVLQKLALKLKPLQSHDADGGGVLGAVINTWPLPQMLSKKKKKKKNKKNRNDDY